MSSVLEAPGGSSAGRALTAEDLDLLEAPSKPRFPEWMVDAAAVIAMGALALWSFVPSFGTFAFVAGAFGLIPGVAWGLACRQRTWSWWVAVLGGLGFYAVVGPGLVAPSLASSGVFPSVPAERALVKTLVSGWADALVTRPPIGRLEALMALPFACGIAIGIGSTWLARSMTRWWMLAPALPLATMVGGIAISTDGPVGSLEGALFGTVAVVWMASRQRRARTITTMAIRDRVRQRRLVGLVLLALVVGLVIGTFGPISNSSARLVPRDNERPPLDQRLAVSPLSEYRVFKVDDRGKALFVVSGSPDGLPLRIGAVNYWDGSTWQTAPPQGTPNDTFERVGTNLPGAPASGNATEVTIAPQDAWAGQVWAPTVGDVSSVSFGGGQASRLDQDLRYDAATGTLAVPGGFSTGETITESVDHAPPGSGEPGSPSASLIAVGPLGGKVTSLVGKSSCGSNGVTSLNCVARYLKANGVLSDGMPGQEQSLAGASSSRLALLAGSIVSSGQQSAGSGATGTAASTAGDAEQFAALLALVAAQEGYPSRVAVGIRALSPGTVTGNDITAWAEVYDGTHWVMLADPVPTRHSAQQASTQNQLAEPVPVQGPSSPVPPPSEHGSSSHCGKGAKSGACNAQAQASGTLALPAWVAPVVGIPLGLVLLFFGVTGALVGLKLLRRNRRRRDGTPAVRISAGWREITDTVRDAGWIVPTSATRRESAVLIGQQSIARVAREADTILFGAAEVDSTKSDAFWGDVDVTTEALLASLSRVDRWKARVNLTSFGLGDHIDRLSGAIRARLEVVLAMVKRAIGRFTQ